MPILAAERSFDDGLMALAEGRHGEAIAAFRQAIDIERQRDLRRPSARYLSFYGLSLARAGRARAKRSRPAAPRSSRSRPSPCTCSTSAGSTWPPAGARRRSSVSPAAWRLAPDHQPLLQEPRHGSPGAGYGSGLATAPRHRARARVAHDPARGSLIADAPLDGGGSPLVRLAPRSQLFPARSSPSWSATPRSRAPSALTPPRAQPLNAQGCTVSGSSPPAADPTPASTAR